MVLLLINSCKKDGGNVPDLNEAINSSKQWFASTKINSYDPDWPNAKLLYENGNLFVAVPTNISYSSIDKLSSILIVDLNTDVITGGMVEFINSNRPIKDEDFVNLYNAISQNNKTAITNNYKGNILLFTPDRHFKLGWQMERGEVTGLIKRANPRPNTAIEKSADLNRQLNKISQAVPDQPTCEDHYWVVYNPITFEIYSYRYLYSICTDGNENQSGGGSTEITEYYPTKRTVTDNTTIPCIKSNVSLGIEANTTIGSILNKTFGPSNEFGGLDLEFREGNTGTDDGWCRKDGNISWVITINQNLPNTSSKEYILATVYHEILHAYLEASYPKDATGMFLIPHDEHQDMADRYLFLMIGALRVNYSGISDKDAWGLAWGGLQETPFYTTKLTADQRRDIGEINRKNKNNLYQ